MHSQLRSNVYTQSTEVRLIHTLSNGDTDIYTHSIEVSLIHTPSNGYNYMIYTQPTEVKWRN